MPVGWRATAQETHACVGVDLMPGTGRDKNGVSRHDIPRFSINFHRGMALQQVVKLFAVPVVMALGGCTGREAGLGQTLIFDGSAGKIEQTTNL